MVDERDRGARPESVTAFDDAYGSLTAQTGRQMLLDFLAGRRTA
ncbi:hypothetical protein [Streptomyces goshikiensis]